MSSQFPPLRFYRVILAEPILCAPFIILYLGLIIFIFGVQPDDATQYPLPIPQFLLASAIVFVVSLIPASVRFAYLRKVFRHATVIQGYVMNVELNNYPKRAPRAELAFMIDGQEHRKSVALISMKDYKEVSQNGAVTILSNSRDPQRCYLLLTYTGVRVFNP